MDIQNLVPGNTVWVVHDDGYCSGSGISGFMFLANVSHYVIASCFVNHLKTLTETLRDYADEVQEEGYTELVVFPEKSCYSSRDDALAALEIEMEEDKQ